VSIYRGILVFLPRDYSVVGASKYIAAAVASRGGFSIDFQMARQVVLEVDALSAVAARSLVKRSVFFPM
jgi:hypothetical protein